MWLTFARRAQFDGYYDRGRFQYLHEELVRQRLVRWRGESPIKKTGCLYSDQFNVYIDTSDGVNEDVPILEYCARMVRVIEDAAGKPFLYFKCSYSPIRSRSLVALAKLANGIVVPFFQWPHNRAWFTELRPQRHTLRAEAKKTPKLHEIFMGANLVPYRYPRPNAADTRFSWQDHTFFGLGSRQMTGWFELTTRQLLHDMLSDSHFRFDFARYLPYLDYVRRSFQSKSVLIPPGYGEYSQRIFDHGWLGQCVIFRKTSYDFGVSWKGSIPEVDFAAPDWEAQLERVLAEFEVWQDKTREYFARNLAPRAMVGYLRQAVAQFDPAALAGVPQLP